MNKLHIAPAGWQLKHALRPQRIGPTEMLGVGQSDRIVYDNKLAETSNSDAATELGDDRCFSEEMVEEDDERSNESRTSLMAAYVAMPTGEESSKEQYPGMLGSGQSKLRLGVGY